MAIELLHNAFLVHDDIADGSEMRRGRPTLAATHGMSAALNAGDGLAIVAGQVLRRATRRLDRDLADLVWGEFDTMAMRTLEGQATEVGWQLDNVEDVGPEDYLNLIMHKTCWYTTIHPLRVGAMVGSRGTAELAPLVRFGFHFGAAFQIRDDLLNLVGDEQMYGKEILGDLFEGKRTLPLVHLLSTATGADRALVRDYLRRDTCGTLARDRARHPCVDGRLRQHHLHHRIRRGHSARSPRTTSSRPSPTPSPGRTSISCVRWCPTCGPGGAKHACRKQ